MTEADGKKFVGAGAADGSGVVTGAMNLASYAPVRDAVIETVSQFTTTQLNTADGKSQLKAELLRALAQVAAKDEHGAAPKHDLSMAPYKIKDVLFTDFAVQ